MKVRGKHGEVGGGEGPEWEGGGHAAGRWCTSWRNKTRAQDHVRNCPGERKKEMDLFHLRENRHWGSRICRSRERGCRGCTEGQSGKNLLKAAVCRLSACVLTHPLRLPCLPLHWSCLVNNFLVAGFQSDFQIPTLGYLFPAQSAAPGPEVWVALPAPPISLSSCRPPLSLGSSTLPGPSHGPSLPGTHERSVSHCSACFTSSEQHHLLCIFFGGLSRPPPAPDLHIHLCVRPLISAPGTEVPRQCASPFLRLPP